MTHHAHIAVIGGGIVGASVLYHLGQLGRRDCILLEKNELTAGATWHAAGNTPSAAGSLLMSRFQAYSIDLYAHLEEQTGQPTGTR
jgi:dimethylglycine dehydrogenase